MERATYTIEEAAKIFGVGRSTMYDMVKRDAIVTVQIGKRRLIPRHIVAKMLQIPPGE